MLIAHKICLDPNAAINVKNLAVSSTGSACGAGMALALCCPAT